MTPTVAFVDNETTSLDRDHREVWECALIRPEAGGWAEYVWQLPVDLSKADPKSLEMNGFHKRRRALDTSRRVGGDDERTEQGRAYQTPLPHFARRFAELTRGLTLVAANVGFDEGDLWKILRANGECPMWHYRSIEVESLAAGWLAGRARGIELLTPKEGPDCQWTMRNTEDGPQSFCTSHETTHQPASTPDVARPPWKHTDLIRALDINPNDFDRHSALGDARLVKMVYERVMG